ncbi:MAG: hypothetical protein ABIY51_01360 [Ferruginibacter sp.]
MKIFFGGIIILCFIPFFSCQYETAESTSEKAIDELIKKYSQLLSNQEEKGTYILKRSITDVPQGFKMELYINSSQADQKIIVITNKSKKVYAIPMFKINQIYFWNIKSAEIKLLEKQVSITFENELRKCNQTLHINKSNLFFLRDLLEHLLLCRENSPQSFAGFPFKVKYAGEYNFIIEILQNRDFKLETEIVFTL